MDTFASMAIAPRAGVANMEPTIVNSRIAKLRKPDDVVLGFIDSVRGAI